MLNGSDKKVPTQQQGNVFHKFGISGGFKDDLFYWWRWLKALKLQQYLGLSLNLLDCILCIDFADIELWCNCIALGVIRKSIQVLQIEIVSL